MKLDIQLTKPCKKTTASIYIYISHSISSTNACMLSFIFSIDGCVNACIEACYLYSVWRHAFMRVHRLGAMRARHLELSWIAVLRLHSLGYSVALHSSFLSEVRQSVDHLIKRLHLECIPPRIQHQRTHLGELNENNFYPKADYVGAHIEIRGWKGIYHTKKTDNMDIWFIFGIGSCVLYQDMYQCLRQSVWLVSCMKARIDLSPGTKLKARLPSNISWISVFRTRSVPIFFRRCFLRSSFFLGSFSLDSLVFLWSALASFVLRICSSFMRIHLSATVKLHNQ